MVTFNEYAEAKFALREVQKKIGDLEEYVAKTKKDHAYLVKTLEDKNRLIEPLREKAWGGGHKSYDDYLIASKAFLDAKKKFHSERGDPFKLIAALERGLIFISTNSDKRMRTELYAEYQKLENIISTYEKENSDREERENQELRDLMDEINTMKDDLEGGF